MEYIKDQYFMYNSFNEAVEARSLVRMVEKVQQTARNFKTDKHALEKEYLKQYAREQRLTGIIVLNDKNKQIAQYHTGPRFKKVLGYVMEKETLRDVKNYPQKSYMTRIELKNGGYIDLASYGRKDAKGTVIGYQYVKTEYAKNNNLTIQNVLAGYKRENDGTIVITNGNYDDYTRLYRFADMQQKDFLKIFMKRYEVDLVRYCLRIVFNHSNVPFDLNYKKPFFDKYSKIRIDQLVMAKNIDHLVDYLKNTEYYAPLSRIRQSGASTLADYELALDLYYFSMMWKKRKGNWDKKDKEMLTKELGAKIDLLNLQWIYRAKKYYHMLAPDIYTLLIPIQHKLSNQEFKDLVEAPSVEEFKRRLNETYYGKKYEFGEQVQIESIVNECVEHILTIAYRNHPYSLASIQQYLFLKEEEIYKITTALECIRYGLSQRETLQYLVQKQRRQGGNAS